MEIEGNKEGVRLKARDERRETKGETKIKLRFSAALFVYEFVTNN
jgi:hypothetical protein